ncbi:MAG: hypothetical protein DRP62_06255 [Planctomycetota bacterium]|nr:MAG: hypothetical protein DRP62_06255 [Planctomycetota bacterium]
MVKQFADIISVTNIIYLTGLALLTWWLLKTSLGKNALVDSAPRRNSMPLYMPFIPLLIWFGGVSLTISITRKLLSDLPDWQSAFLDNLILCVGALISITVIVFLVRANFARRLKGFGLNVKTIHKDFSAAVVNLLAVWPPLIFMIVLTTLFGKLIFGQQFEMQQHEELKMITAYPQLAVRMMIVITAAVVVPTFEEMLFRGLFQTMLRSYLLKPWLSIVITSGLFAIVHADAGHWPALFVLSMCMGYSYEKSGSLFRPIFIHCLFNAISITAVLHSA